MVANGLPAEALHDLPARIIAGEQPAAGWAELYGCSDEEIFEIHRLADQWLARHGLKFVRVALPSLRPPAVSPNADKPR
jgi:hypothetical protein